MIDRVFFEFQKMWILVTACIVICISCHGKSICIDSVQEYAILDQFFKTTVLSEEYGYVLEGSKPISIRNFPALDSFPISNDLKYEEKQFNHGILVRKVIPLWKKFCGQQKNFVLKVITLNERGSSFLSPLEVAFINVAKLQEVVEKNIDLFRYILGPTNTIQDIVDTMINSNESLINILNNNLTLVGIVLGFGTHNSLVGGRQETICALSISKDCPPFSPQSYLMQSSGEHSLDFLTPERYGSYYLEIAGGDDINFRVDFPRLKSQSKFLSLIDELNKIDQLEEEIPSTLRQEPKFIFGAFKGGAPNQPFFKQLSETQKKIRLLLSDSCFLERVLEKIHKKQPLIRGKKAISNNPSIFELDPDVWNEILHSVANRFVDKETKLAFIKAFNQPEDSYRKAPTMMGTSRAVLEGLKKARNNLAKADLQFDQLSQDTTLKELVFKRLYFKTILQGNETKLGSEDRVRIGFVIEDVDGNVLFANHDSWVHLSETFPGFAHGLQEMHVQEKRILFIHPTLAYGALTTLPPCSALMIKVQLLDIDLQSVGVLPALKSIDLDWVQNSSFYNKIEESLIQQPYFTGVFYREMVGKLKQSKPLVLIGGSQKSENKNVTLKDNLEPLQVSSP
ncbi:MAG: FKBP-type peptidyl-prolyl cis-trans isomerase [Chlamydiales bacterium]|nr:FKBP-type peptidyl-prolyl cis-trans isomerase [Chlamydiales bacterium]